MKRKKRLVQEGVYGDLATRWKSRPRTYSEGAKRGAAFRSKQIGKIKTAGVNTSAYGVKVGGGTGAALTKAGGIMQRHAGKVYTGGLVAGGVGLVAALAKRRKKKTVAQEAAIRPILSKLRPRNVVRKIGSRISSNANDEVFYHNDSFTPFPRSVRDIKRNRETSKKVGRAIKKHEIGKALYSNAPVADVVAGGTAIGGAAAVIAKRRKKKIKEAAISRIRPKNLIRGIGQRIARSGERRLFTGQSNAIKGTEMADLGKIMKSRAQMSKGTRLKRVGTVLDKGAPAFEVAGTVGTGAAGYGIARRKIRKRRATQTQESVLRSGRTLKKLVGQDRKIIRKLRIGKKLPDWQGNKTTIEVGGQQARSRKLIDDLKAMRDAKVPSKIRRRVLSKDMKQRMDT